MIEVRNAYNILLGKHEWKRALETPSYRWEDIKLSQEIG
jgi:hypothetical protein